MTALESLTLRIREVRADAKAPLHISAPVGLIDKMIDEFLARGETPEFDDDVVWFGPHIAVYVDDFLLPATFKIESLACRCVPARYKLATFGVSIRSERRRLRDGSAHRN
jgi:hypothetical protein